VNVCLNVWDVDLVVTQLVTQQSGLASLGFLMSPPRWPAARCSYDHSLLLWFDPEET
jgi:hypothetical protein